ncbi:MAG: hypothetical protein ABSC29_01140 [Minisyncoccia bacterium]|jgi:hypothetical protein
MKYQLAGAQKPQNCPAWLTQEHMDRCAADSDLQHGWEPKIGDWYLCEDLYMVSQITSLESYYSEGDVRAVLKSDRRKDSRGHWPCDIYLPEPAKVSVAA